MNAPTRGFRNPAIIFAVAIFLSSSLLFLIEPVVAKRLLPLLGGSAAVWTTCLVFFQCSLLLGYLTAHWLVTRTAPRQQVTWYLLLLGLAFAQLALNVRPERSANTAHPIGGVLWLLVVRIGLPFVILSATSPLLQAWYARTISHASTTGESDREPSRAYRLFAVSNIGSLLALLAYPWLIEPRVTLQAQSIALAAGFAVVAIVCATIARSMREIPALPVANATASTSAVTGGTHVADRIFWVALPACASLLLSAVTNNLTQQIAPIPLLWIVPLVLYLLTFVIAFSGDTERWLPRWLTVGLGIAGLGTAGSVLFFGEDGYPPNSLIVILCLVCVGFFFICLMCHSELYRRRPAAHALTPFYLAVAAGGALGALLVGVAAPLLLPGGYEFGFGLCATAILGLAVTWSAGTSWRFVWALVCVMTLFIPLAQIPDSKTEIARYRNFYGTLVVKQREISPAPTLDAMQNDGGYVTVRSLVHGPTVHGQQVFRTDLFNQPTTYYAHRSGVGLAIDWCCNGRSRRIGVIGLGVGTIAAYGRTGDVIRFYEINPAVEPIARKYFRYLANSAARVDVVEGDARVSLTGEASQQFDVLVVDAFSGDAIPVHLVTIEALALYRRHLAPNGILAFHVTNNFLSLPPVIRQLAEQAGLKAVDVATEGDPNKDLLTTDWVLVTANEAFLNLPAVASASQQISPAPGLRLWTDDYNSLLPILHVRE